MANHIGSSVPDALAGFMSIATAAFPEGVQVWFGKPLPRYEAPITLQILGVRPGEQEAITLGPDYTREERYSIECLLTSYAGDPDYIGRAQEVFTEFHLLTIAVANNPTLNGAVRFAEIKSFEYVPDADGAGKTLGALTFTVDCQARITSLT